MLGTTDDLLEPTRLFNERIRRRILLDFDKNLASLLKCLEFGAVSTHFRQPLQLHAHFLVEIVEFVDAFNHDMCSAFDARKNFLEQL